MEQLRLILIAGLALVGVLLYQAWQEATLPAQAATPATASPFDAAPEVPTPGPAPTVAAGDAPPAVPQPVEPEATGPASVAASDEEDAGSVWVQTDVYEARISLRGADLKEVRLRKHRRSAEDDSPPLALLNDSRRRFFVAQSGIVSAEGASPLHTSVWEYQGPKRVSLADGGEQLPLRFTWRDASGREVQRTYHFARGSYEIEVSQTLVNQGEAEWVASPYWRYVRNADGGNGDVPFVATFTGVGMYALDDGSYRFRKHDLDDLGDEPVTLSQPGGWTAMMEHYFLAAIIPPAQEQNNLYARPSKIADFLTEYVAEPVRVAAGARAEHAVRLYLGPKLQNELGAVSPGLELTIDYGLLTPISEPLFWVMDKFHDLTGNWGWSIILVTLLVKGLFFKLSEAQYRSMARMKKFAPRIQQLKERYADDRQRLHQAMMDLYQKEGFNPLAGCWPMLVQFPVFIALYWVLLESVELRHADFVLWLDDLSSPDPFFVLPVLFGASMFLQQKLSGQAMTMEPMQQKIMNIMPIALTVFFAFFPSGLVLYWFVSNLIGILQQWIITRRMEAAEGG